MRRALQLLLAVAGAVLLLLLVRSIGAARLADDLGRIGLGLAIVVLLELVIDALNTVAWRRTFARPGAVGYWRLFWVRLAGTAVNQLTPTATVGGELVKAVLVRPHLSTADAVASLIAARMSYAIAQAALVLLGLAAILGRLGEAPELRIAVVLGFALTATGVGAFVLLQRRGVFGAAAAHGARLGLPAALAASLRAGGQALDRRLAALYRDRPGAFAASIAWHLGGQLVGLVQLWLILTWLGIPAGLGTCLAIEALSIVIDSATFFVPGRLGVQEGGRVLALTALGMSAASGLALAVVVRLSQLATAALGLAAYGYFSLASARSISEP
jgi:hypothetical protein